jgi:hypothetical protein
MKASIVLLYLRIFPPTGSSAFRKICAQLLVTALLAIIIAVCVSVFACWTIPLSWTDYYEHTKDHCMNMPAAFYSVVLLNMLFDLGIFFAPIPMM